MEVEYVLVELVQPTRHIRIYRLEDLYLGCLNICWQRWGVLLFKKLQSKNKLWNKFFPVTIEVE